MQPPIVRVLRLHPNATIPLRSSRGATGFDIFARLDAPMELRGHPAKVSTGIALECPFGFDMQVRPRSGLSARGVGVALGTIDADYRGELLVTMWTFGDLERYEVHDGDRIAQLVITALAPVDVLEVAELSSSERGVGGHGSTGR